MKGKNNPETRGPKLPIKYYYYPYQAEITYIFLYLNIIYLNGLLDILGLFIILMS